MGWMACPMARFKPSCVLAFAPVRMAIAPAGMAFAPAGMALTFDHASSMGLRSGEQPASDALRRQQIFLTQPHTVCLLLTRCAGSLGGYHPEGSGARPPDADRSGVLMRRERHRNQQAPGPLGAGRRSSDTVAMWSILIASRPPGSGVELA